MADREDWARRDALLDAALERPAAERDRFLDEACRNDPQERLHVAELLRLAEDPDERLQPGGGLRGPVWEDLAEELEADDQAPLPEGTAVGRYVIRGLLGTGGMGRVYRALDPSLGREVAIKAVARDFRDDAASLRRFEREARLLATLNHPNIGSIYGFELVLGTPYLVLELIEGPTLRERLESGPLPVPEALAVAVQIADALQEAHEKGIVHRDLKPANVKITEGGRVKILDFGIAKPVAGTADEDDTPTAGIHPTTLPGAVVGTAPYMSPEQARGLPVDTRSDVWAFGCLLYEMLTGERAFPGTSPSDVLAAVLRDDVDFSRLPPDTPAGMRRLLRRCLRKDPRDRLQDAGDARLELTEAAMEDPPAAAPRGGWRRLLRPTLFGLAAAVVLTALGLQLLSNRHVSPGPGVVRLSLDLPTAFPLAGDYAAPFALSPDGTTLVLLSRRAPDQQDASELYERSLHGLAVTAIPGTKGAWQPTFSPDGRKLAFFADRKLKTVSLGGGPMEALAEIGGNPRGASWGEDGTIVVSPSQGSGLMRVDARGGRPRPLTELDEAKGEISHRWPQVLPGGRHVLFTVALEDEAYDDARLEVVSLDTGERRALLAGGAHARYVSTGHLVFARGGRLLAVPFDLETLTVRGTPTVMTEGVRYDPRNGGTHMALSSNGTLVYGLGTQTSPDQRLAWLEASGEIRPITDTPRAFRELRLSPDARRVALVIGRGAETDLWLLDLPSGTLSQLTFGQRPRRPLWTPDGRHIVVAVPVPDGPRWRLASVPRDGGAPVALLETDRRAYPNVFTPDGRRLIYQERRPGAGWDLMTADLDAAGKVTGTHPLLVSQFHEANADLSPDGRFLAYESDELDNVFEVYVRPLEGGVKVRATTTGARWPRFGAFGRLFYWYTFDGRLYQLDYRAEPNRLVTGPGKPVFPDSAGVSPHRIQVRASYESYDLDVPRHRFLALESATASEPQFARPVVVLNWAEELRALTAQP